MTLSEYICELLYRYNCVIVPDFGAFLTQRIPASISKEVKLFYPPQKRISFNKQIINNDGLLANYIAKSESISYEEANLKIRKFVQEIHSELDTNGRFSFSEVGFFTINFEQNLTFEPLHTANYLTESFGLAPFQTSEIFRSTDVEIVEEEILEISDEQEAIPKKRSYLLKYAAVGVLLFGISGVGLKSINNSTQLQANKEVKDELQSASFVFEVDEVLPSINIELKKPEAKSAVLPNYHIIAGAFREFNNATKKLNQLKQKGFNATYVGQNKYGLHQIAYNSYFNENDAINALNRLKKEENSSAWLLSLNK